MPSAPRKNHNESNTTNNPHYSGSTTACVIRSDSTESDEFGLELAISQTEAEQMARGDVPSAVQDVILSLLIAMGQTVRERCDYQKLKGLQ